jgi:AcrR family transcriptional regulator
MKAVAGRLGPYSAMALYRYVHSKDGLVDLMLDTAAAEVPLPGRPGPDWRADLQSLAARTRLMTKRHPWYPALFHTRPPAGPHTMQRLEFMLTVLVAQGTSTAEAMTYAALIDRHIFGSGLQEAEEARMSQRHGLDDGAELTAALAMVHDLAAASGRYPNLASWLARPAGPSADEQFGLGLGFLLDGIAGRLPGNVVP